MPTNDKRPLKVFLCHASADKPAVRNLYQRLIADGVDAWLDAESLIAGQNWQVEIPKAISDSDVVLVCLSEKSINKEGYVQREIKFALDVADEKPEGTIFVIPVRLEECKVPDRLSMYHWVELFEKGGYERLLRALSARARNIGVTSQIKKQPPDAIKVTTSYRYLVFALPFIMLTLIAIYGLPSLNAQPKLDLILTHTMGVNTPLSVLATETVMPNITPSFVTSTIPPIFTNIVTVTSENSEILLGKWIFSENFCERVIYSELFFVNINGDGTFTRGEVTRIEDGIRTELPDYGVKEGTWNIQGDEITLIAGPDRYVGKLEGKTISGLIFHEGQNLIMCLYAVFNE